MLKCGALCALLAMGKGDQMEWFEAVDAFIYIKTKFKKSKK